MRAALAMDHQSAEEIAAMLGLDARSDIVQEAWRAQQHQAQQAAQREKKRRRVERMLGDHLTSGERDLAPASPALEQKRRRSSTDRYAPPTTGKAAETAASDDDDDAEAEAAASDDDSSSSDEESADQHVPGEQDGCDGRARMRQFLSRVTFVARVVSPRRAQDASRRGGGSGPDRE